MNPYRKKEPRRPGPDLESLEHGVVEALPGLVVVDRLLDLGGGAVADLAAVDAEGALVLVLSIQEDDDAAAVLVLDALAFARENALLLPRHFEAAELRAERPARVCIVAPGPCPRLTSRLAPLLGARVDLFELRRLKSAGSEQTYLVRSAQPAGPPPARETGPERFLATLQRESRATAEDLLGRMERMDPELVLCGEEEQLTWSLGADLIARLDVDRGRLRGAVPPRLVEREVEAPQDVERFLGEAMGRFADLLDVGGGNPLGAGGTPGRGQLVGGPDVGGPGERGVAAPARRPEALDVVLTPAEIEAFREL